MPRTIVSCVDFATARAAFARRRSQRQRGVAETRTLSQLSGRAGTLEACCFHVEGGVVIVDRTSIVERDPGLYRDPARRRADWAGVRRALGVAGVGVAILAAVYSAFVLSSVGQRIDQGGLNHLADGLASRQAVASWLRGVTVGAVVVVLAGCLGVAVARRRFTLGLVGVAIVAGSVLTTEVLKHVVLVRPHLGHGWTNSLPSGHATVVTSLALAALLVAPRGWRAPVSLCAAVAVSVAGVGTVVANWHRPSDVIAAYTVCLVWGSLGLAAVSWRVVGGRREPVARAHTLALLTGLALAAAAFLEVGVRPNGTTRDLFVHVVIMCGIATAGAVIIGVFTRMANARTD